MKKTEHRHILTMNFIYKQEQTLIFNNNKLTKKNKLNVL